MTSSKTLLAALPVLLALVSCQPRPGPYEAAQLLNSLGFNQPVTVSLQLNRIPDVEPGVDDGRLDNNPDAAIASVLLTTKLLSTLPNSAAAPWWRLAVQGGEVRGQTFSFVAGTRSDVQPADITRWTEGGIPHFAQTLRYSITWNRHLQAVMTTPIEGLSIRIVAKNDPAVGHWELVRGGPRGTLYAQDDSSVLHQRLAATGAAHILDLASAIVTAKQNAFDEIEARLAKDGLLARYTESDASILVSKAHHLLYLKGTAFEGAKSTTLGALIQYCGNQTQAHRSWRLPTESELDSVFGHLSFFNGTSLIDTPDHRLWSDLVPLRAAGVLLVSRTAPMYASYSNNQHIFNVSAYRYEQMGAQFASEFQKTVLMVQGSDALSATLLDRLPIKVLCVADLVESSPK